MSTKQNPKYAPHKDFPFWCNDPEGDGLIFFRTEAERDSFAEEVIRAYLDGGEWQPIETAPSDGTEVILRFVVRDGPARRVEILNGWYDGSWRRICYNTNSYQYFSFGDITHWMPIPKPPTE